MSKQDLRHEMDQGVEFWGYDIGRTLAGEMGVQQVQDVTLIRHAYVLTSGQRTGIGGQLLAHLRTLTNRPVLIGAWAIRFYEKHGFQIVSTAEKNSLLKRYWTVPPRQIETPVVLADAAWRNQARAYGLDNGAVQSD